MNWGNWGKVVVSLLIISASAVVLLIALDTHSPVMAATATGPATMQVTAATMPATNPAVAKVALPKPRMEGGMPLMEALKNRKSMRQFSEMDLSDQTLSDLLWAACGVNRPDGRRTAPTAMNRQEIDVYVVKADGIWLYDAAANALERVTFGDHRQLTGRQPFVKNAPVNLVFVADMGKEEGPASADAAIWTAADTGFISQNVYLFCASEHLATVVRGMVDRRPLSQAMHLRDNQKIVLAQTVGYPAVHDGPE